MTRFERLFVWLGGAMFACSIAVCAYTYIVDWAQSARPFAPASVAIDAGLFAIFAAHHSLLARNGLKERLERIAPARLLRPLYVWAASVLLLAVLGFWAPVGGDVYRANGLLALALTAVQIAGVLLIARSAATINPLELAGIHGQTPHEGLQVKGPYRLVRHPLYLGWILAVFGAAHMTGDRLTFAAITTIYVALAIPWEERSLLAAFGAEYSRYQETVRWRIVPYLY